MSNSSTRWTYGVLMTMAACLSLALPTSAQKVQKIQFNIPTKEIELTQGEPIYIRLCHGVGIAAPPTITNPTMGNMMGAGECGTIGTPTSNPSGGTPPYHFQVEGNGLPFGLSLSQAGFITGIPNVKDSRDVKICAMDAALRSDCQRIHIKVKPNPQAQAKMTARGSSFNPFSAIPDREPVDKTPSAGQWGHPMSGPMAASLAVGAGLGAGLGGYYLADKLSPVGSGDSSSSSSSANKFDGNYTAVRSFSIASITSLPLSQAPCGDVASCLPASPFTFTVTNSKITDRCSGGNLFSSSSIPSSGSFSGEYGAFIPVTGNWSTSTFTLQGSRSDQYCRYTVGLTITKTQ